ncbi:MAG: twin-arginine translocase subunit TatC [Magnetococcales bacterium]|nr:twin-arginine translocase subunit TatC [Magnetococcales bacterium]MBF0323038.1 twin-arginine translocase subunit TatC [Magnetococcales bacterium]
MMQPDEKAPFLDHLIELRHRLVVAAATILGSFLVCWSLFSQELFAFLSAPMREILGPTGKMVMTAPHEAFFTYAKISFFAGLFISIPVVLTQLWLFVAPGLYKNERKAFLPFLIAAPALFFAGGASAYYVVFPTAFRYFLGLVTDQSIETMITMRSYLDLVIALIFAFGLTFELPVALLLLVKARIISVAALVNKRRYNIVLVFVIAAFLTPPDPISQILLAIPMLLMYELSIFLGRRIEKRRDQEEAMDGDGQEEDSPP